MAGSGLRRHFGAVALAAACILPSCSDAASTLDPKRTEAAILTAMPDDLPVDVERITCPEQIPRGAGEIFRCEAETDVGALRLAVHQTPDDGVEIEILDTVVDMSKVARDVEADLADALGRSFRADCGPEGEAVVDVGRVIRCHVSDDHDGRDVEVTVVDHRGGLAIDVG